MFVSLRLALLFVVLVSSARAQTPAPPATSPQPKDDLLNAPLCNSYRLSEQAPLSAKQKVCYFGHNKVVSGSGLFGAAFFAGIAQWRRDPPDWQQGASGFGRRFGTRYAQGLTKSTAELLFGWWEDPRPHPPVQMPTAAVPFPHVHRYSNQSLGGRLGRALLRVVWTHYDSGHDGIAFSRIGGALSSGLVGRAWTPDPGNTWGQVFVRTGSAFGGYAASSTFNEFQPDLAKLLGAVFGQRKPPQPPKPASQSPTAKPEESARGNQ